MKVLTRNYDVFTKLCDEAQLNPKRGIEIGEKRILWNIMKLYPHHWVNGYIIIGYERPTIKEYIAISLRNTYVTNDIPQIIHRFQEIAVHMESM